MDEFYTQLADIFEVDEITSESILRNFEAWDSLTFLSILALADSYYGISMTANDLEQFTTVGQLADYLVENRIK